MKSPISSSGKIRKWGIGRVFGSLFIGLCVVVIALSVVVPRWSSAASAPIKFKAVAGTFVQSDAPDHNFSSESRVDVAATPETHGFLRFQIGGIGQGGSYNARLRLYVDHAGGQAGLKVFSTAPDWDAAQLTWNNQPALGAQVADLPATELRHGKWIELDLGQGVLNDGVYSFALTSDSPQRIEFSRAHEPQLVLTPLSSAAPEAAQPQPAAPEAAQQPAAPEAAQALATPAPAPSTNPAGCLPGELSIDAQDWWMPTPGVSGGKDFGHLHTSLCFPHKATITGKMTLRIRSTLHHNPGQFRRISIQIFAPQVAGSSGACGDSTAVACVNFSPVRTCPIDQTCRWEDLITFDTARVAYDGWQEVRVHGIVAQPDGTTMRTSTGLHIYLKNGHPIKNVSADPNMTMARGWYTNANYATASIISPPMGPVSGIWQPNVRFAPGAGGIPVTGWYAALDTDFHNGNPGIPLCPGSLIGTDMQPQCAKGEYRGKLVIDTTKLANGWHRLFLKTDAIVASAGTTHSGVLAIYFEVQNGQALSQSSPLAAAPANAWICDLS